MDWSSNIDEEPYRELYVRWLEWGTFLPFMRNVSHSEPHAKRMQLIAGLARCALVQCPERIHLQQRTMDIWGLESPHHQILHQTPLHTHTIPDFHL